MKNLWLVSGLAMSLFGTSTFAEAKLLREEQLIRVVASGEASAKPEVVSISITVTSNCYDRPTLARNANATSATAVFEKMKSFAQEGEEPTATGAWIVPDSTYNPVKDERGVTNYVLACPGKWSTSQSLSLSTKAIEKTAEIQEELLTTLEQINGNQTANVGAPSTKLSMSAPYADVSNATRKKLQLEAIENAADNAQAEATVISNRFSLGSFSLVSYGEILSSDGMPKYARAEMSSARSAGDVPNGPGSPVAFDKVTISETRQFTFSF